MYFNLWIDMFVDRVQGWDVTIVKERFKCDDLLAYEPLIETDMLTRTFAICLNVFDGVEIFEEEACGTVNTSASEV